jgi:hypothetical protein
MAETTCRPSHPAASLPARRGGVDRDLSAILAALLAEPVVLPGWSAARWRTAISQPLRAGNMPTPICDARLGPLMAWVTRRTGPQRHLGALAAVLAVLDDALNSGQADSAAMAVRVERAAVTARPLGLRPRSQARVTPSAGLDRRAAPGVSVRERRVESPFVEIAFAVLGQAGCDVGADPAFAARLGAALDVAVDHWLGDSPPGAGLPGFRSENLLRSTSRLTALLGRDRDLRYLVYGPQPGRGRSLQTARCRGLVYWVAVAMVARHLGEPAPSVPRDVAVHWRRELWRLGSPAGPEPTLAADSSDAPSS